MATKISEFDKDSQKILQQWFTIRSIAKSTEITYLSYISQFLKLTNTTLNQIYIKSIEQQNNNIPLNQRELTQLIIQYKYHIDSQKYAQTTRNLKMKVIYSFCKAFDLETPKIRQKNALCEEKNYERPITKREILKLLQTNPLREKAFLVLQATSGMSSKEARTLTIYDLLKIINTELHTEYTEATDLIKNKEKIIQKDAYEIKKIREKVNYRYITYINKEAMTHLINYIDYRQKQTNNKKLTNNIHDPIFITNQGKAMNSRAVTAMYREMGNKVGFISENNTYRFWRSHNIRKYFYNICEDIVGQEYADEWLGHVPSAVTRAYARREYRMKEAYLKCLPALTLEEDITKVKSKLNDLEKEIMKLKGELK